MAESTRSESFWKNPEYLSWFTADTASAVGLSIKTLSLSLLGYSVSGSLVSAGWLGTLSLVAQQGLSIFGGTYIDRHDRKRLIAFNALAGFVLWGTIAILGLVNHLSFTVLIVLSVTASAINGFLGGATDAMLRSIIGVRNYPKARSINEGRDSTVNMTGSPLSGFLYSLHPMLPFFTASFMYAIAGIAAFGLKTGNQQIEKTQSDRKSYGQDFLSGWKWSLKRKTVVLSVGAASLASFGINGIQYAIQLDLTGKRVNSTYIGLVGAGICLGMIAGSLIANKISNTAPVGKSVCLAFACISLFMIPMVVSGNQLVIITCNSLIGIPFPIINSLLVGFIFAKAPNQMQGRIGVTLTAPSQMAAAFCSAIAGTLLTAIGFRATVMVFSSTFFLGTLMILTSRSIRQIPSSAQWEEAVL